MTNKIPDKEPLCYLSFRHKDFAEAGLEIPPCLENNFEKTEGELMSDEEIVDWIIDTKKTFQVMQEYNPNEYKTVLAGFILDLNYLVKIDRLSEDNLDEILSDI